MNIGGVPQSRLPQRQTPVKAGGGLDGTQQPPQTFGGDAATFTSTQQAPAQPGGQQSTFGTVLANVFNGLMTMFKGLFQFIANLFNGGHGTNATTPTSTLPTGTPGLPPGGTPTQPTTPAAPGALDAQSAAIAKQYNLYPTKENVQAFMTEVQGYSNASAGVLGPGATGQAVTDLQGALQKLGFQVTVTGTYDQATAAAVHGFKASNNIMQSYRTADGQFAVNEYADLSTQAVIKTKANMVGGAPTQPTQPAQPTQPTSTGSSNWQAIATQYRLQPSEQNVNAFLAEVKQYQLDGALGPGSQQTQAIKDLQGALGRLGIQVPVTGQYDQATQQAVISFKTANGMHQTYRAADGNFAINEYADKQTLELIMTKLQAMMTGQPPVQQPPVQQPPVQQPPVQQPPVQQPAQPSGPRGPWDVPGGQRDYYAISQQYQLLNQSDNVDAFCNEMKAYESNGALGPGSTNTQAIRDLQGALARLGYQIPQTGTYDQQTMGAIVAFKQAAGIRQSYRGRDGNPAINEWADAQTLQAIMQRLQAGVQAQPPVQQPPVQQPPVQQPPVQQPQPGQPNIAAIAAQYRIQATPENVQAFMNEVRGYQSEGALGPGSQQKQAITDLQTVLQKWGYQVAPNGQYDQATQQAVLAYKRQSGLHQSYKAQDGNWAVNEYADKQTLESIMSRLQKEMGKAS